MMAARPPGVPISTTPAPGTSARPRAESGLGRPYRVLLVEDDRGDALLVEVGLEEALPGSTVIWRSTLPSEAEAAREQPDCILVDLGLPGCAGLEALDAMVERASGAPVIVLTGLNDREAGIEAVSRGADDYLVKGVDDPETLARAIRYAVERSHAEAARAMYRETQLLRAENLRLERGLLPRPLLADPSMEWTSRYRPGAGSSILGGDFFDTVETDDGSIRMVIGDVSGHGPEEAALGVCLRIAWRALVLAGRPDEEVLPGIDSVFRAERQSEQFCTVCDVTITPDRRRISTRLAGHPPPILMSAAGVGLVDGTHRGAPLGVSRSVWRTAWLDAETPWCLLLYTDGLYEPRLPDGTRLGLERMVGLVAAEQLPGSHEELDRLLDVVQAPHVAAGHDDDVAIVGLLSS